VLRQSIEEAKKFVREALLSSQRRNPLLVITSKKDYGGSWHPLVEPDRLARSLSGMVQVVQVEAPLRASEDAFQTALDGAGLGRSLKVFDGGVRLYLPGMTTNDPMERHHLWTHLYLDRQSSRAATASLIQQIALLASSYALPSGFMGAMDAADRQRRSRGIKAVVQRVSTRLEDDAQAPVEDRPSEGHDETAVVSADSATVDSSKNSQADDIRALLVQVENLQAENLVFGEENDRLESEARKLRTELELLRGERDELRAQLERGRARQPHRDVAKDREVLSHSVLKGDPTLEQALEYLQDAFPSRVEVLPSAFKSAREAVGFKFKDRAWDLQIKLVTEYWDLMANGDGGDAKARGVFGNAYSAQEAALASTSDRGVRLRTFMYRGEPVTMVRHLRIGVKEDSLAETWRLHFHWDGERKKIVIGHSGKHLDFN
jgi:hypothetical protein